MMQFVYPLKRVRLEDVQICVSNIKKLFLIDFHEIRK